MRLFSLFCEALVRERCVVEALTDANELLDARCDRLAAQVRGSHAVLYILSSYRVQGKASTVLTHRLSHRRRQQLTIKHRKQ